MPDRFLGKREPVNRPTLLVGEFLTAQEIPVHPPTLAPPPVNWTMDRNDQAGDCVVAGMNHTLQAIATNLGLPRTPWTDAQLLDLYRTQNPDFHGWSDGGSDADQGMVIQTFLEECVQRGHILAFARIDHENSELMRAATFIGGGIMTGEVLRNPHASQNPWTSVTGGGLWGGHCTTTVAYAQGVQQCVTWGALQGYTDGFAERHMDEAWFVLTRDLIDAPSFRNSFDLAGFADAVADLTGGKVIVPVPPPVVLPPPVQFPYATLDEWARHTPRSDSKRDRLAKESYRLWRANPA